MPTTPRTTRREMIETNSRRRNIAAPSSSASVTNNNKLERRSSRHWHISYSHCSLCTLLLMIAAFKPTEFVKAMATPNKASSLTYDLVIVGGGSAGLTAAKLSGKTLKKSTLIIEADRLGGDCTWTGCVPSKSLLASAKAAQMARKFAIQTNSKVPMVNFAQVQTYFRKNQQDIYERDDSPEAMAAFNVDTLKGMATLTSPQTLSVSTMQDETNASESTTTTTVVTANEGIILCTGATAAMADIPGLADVRVVTYEDVWQLDALPKRLTVVGGGPIGVELAQAMSRLGSQVTIVASQLLPREELEVSKLLQQVFEEDEGITCVKGRLDKVEKSGGNGSHKAYVSNGDSSQVATVEGDVILLSVGRKPNTKGLGLENVGIGLTDNGGISVDDKLQTSVKGIYAAGDCIGEKQFTHYAGYQGAIAARNILLPLSDPGVLQDIPATTFTSPEVASVGYSEAAAKKEFGENAVAVSKMDLSEVDRAVCDGETKGFLKVIYKKRGGKILGATIMAPVAGELISEIVVAMKAGMSFPDLAKAIHPYPSYAIALQIMASEAYYENVGRYRAIYDFLKKLGL